LAEVKRADGAKEKNLAAKVAIGKFRKKNKEKREKDTGAKDKADAKASGNGETGVNGQKTVESETTASGDGDDASGTPAELPGDDVDEGADNGQAEDSSTGKAGQSETTKARTDASDTVEVTVPAEDTQEGASIGTYRKVLEVYPGEFEGLVDSIDEIIGKVMDADATVVALQRIVDNALTLIEAEKAKAAALAGTPA
jgi:hypothetical protein